MVTHTPRPLRSSPSLSSLPPLSFLRLRDLSHPLIWPDMHNVKNSTDAEQGRAGWLSCLTEKWLADAKLSNWKEWNTVITGRRESVCASVSNCEHLFAPEEPWADIYTCFVLFCFFYFQVCMTVCLSVALDDLHKFSFSTSSFTLHCLMGCCYWQPQPKGTVELVQMTVQQVLCFQSPGENWRGKATWPKVHVFFPLHSCFIQSLTLNMILLFCEKRHTDKL